MPDTWTANLHCSFCAKASGEVAKLIAGPGVFICNECVGLCEEILQQEQAVQETAPRLPMWETMTEEQILEHLPRISAVQAQIDDNLHDWVGHLRTREVSWERIGASLGMTRQSAWERFR